MTSTSPIGTPALARTVRDVVAHQPELVNEVWCRKIFRHVLQLLERQHALRLPHLPISPDTIAFDSQGELMLLPATEGTPAPGEAADVQALGAVIHYAITGESVPGRSLRARGTDGYSDSLVTAVDRCMAYEARERPQSIGELRNLLGIVALGPALPVATPAPSFMEVAPSVRGGIAMLGKWQRWMLIGLAAVVLLGAASAYLMLLRGTDARDNVVLSLPEHGNVPAARSLGPGEKLVVAEHPENQMGFPPARERRGVAEQALPLPPAQPQQQQQARLDDPDDSAVDGSRDNKTDGKTVAVKPGPGMAREQQAQAAQSSIKLLIKPWGTVYVDGVARGVSPPLKRLAVPAGRHTVRVVNPNFRDRVIHIDAGKQGAGRINVDFAANSR